MRNCSLCNQDKALDCFDVCKPATGQLYRWCRECRRAKARDYYHKNREKYKAQSKAYKRKPEYLSAITKLRELGLTQRGTPLKRQRKLCLLTEIQPH